jgi:hypothetical protein
MSNELQLAQFREFFLAATQQSKPTVSDEDNAASLYLDDTGWTIDRKRAWMAVMCGSHYDFIDFSIQAHLEGGTDESQRKIRTWIKNLSEFIHSFDFIRASRTQDWIVKQPDHTVGAGLAVPGKDYVAYLADSREVTDPEAGKPIRGEASLQLPEGDYSMRFYSPVAGEFFHASKIKGGKVSVAVGPFVHDLALRITRTE